MYIVSNIVHPESFRSKIQIAITFACRNRLFAMMSLRAFICIHVFAFAFVCEYCSPSTMCAYVRVYARMYVYTCMM